MPSLTINGESLYYAESGARGPTVVLVHGSGGDHTTWSPQLAGLSDMARIVALDLPGHGASGAEGCDTVADYGATVRQFLIALGGGPVVLGGHSLGGAVSLTLALEAPDLLRGLVLVGTGARLRVLPALFEILARDYAEAVAFMTDHAWSLASPAELKQRGRETVSATRPSVTRGDFQACDNFDVMARLGEIRLPSLVVVGGEDRLTPPKYSEYLTRSLPGAKLEVIERAGHFVSLEQPDFVNRAVRDFLGKLGPS
jgi:pimeloyl-ACP methyl ester carboxylesterase